MKEKKDQGMLEGILKVQEIKEMNLKVQEFLYLPKVPVAVCQVPRVTESPGHLDIWRLHCTALHCTALHCTALRCTALH